MNKDQRAEYIRALLRERQGAVQYERTGTVEEIDAELRKVGHTAASPHQRAERMTLPERGPVDNQKAPEVASKPPATTEGVSKPSPQGGNRQQRRQGGKR